MKKTYLMLILALMLLVIQTAVAGTATINLNTEKQTIRGFGGMNFPRWGRGLLTDAQVDTAFGNGPGQIGLTIMRIDVPPDNNGGTKWGLALSAAQRAINNHGAIVFASPWTPPPSMKDNNSTYGGTQNTLKTGSYGAFANYLRDFANYFSSNGAPLYAISVQNEPDYSPGYESCVYSATQMQTFLNNNASVIPTRMIAPETTGFNSNYMNTVASSSECNIVACHIYGGNGSYSYPGKEYWMTEHYTESATDGNVWPLALDVGKEIHDCMANNMNAYVWWYIRRYYGPMGESGNITKRGYCMSHFAKFARPGYIRVDATASPQANVYVTAYKSNTNDANLVIVAVNQNSSSQSVTFSLSGGTVSSYTKYQTASDSNLSNMGSVGSTNTLAANSINTFVGTIVFETCDDVQAAGYGLPSDISGDCYVDFEDFAIIADYWLSKDCGLLNNYCDGADLEPMDGVVDFSDLGTFVKQWLWCNNPEDPGCGQ
jgi:O-glycosyl hydrolase